MKGKNIDTLNKKTPWDIVMKALKSADVTGGPTTHEGFACEIP